MVAVTEAEENSSLPKGNGFLYKMVRNIVGTLLLLAAAKRIPLWSGDLAHGDRQAAGPTAPPQGLTLVCVEY